MLDSNIGEIMINQFTKNLIRSFILCLLCFCATRAQTTAFSYQGKLTDSTVPQPTNGTYDVQFRLFDVPGGGQGTQQGATITNPAVPVTNGIFTVSLDFGQAVFAAGADVYLEISLRQAGSNSGYTSLAPRQRLTSSPYSIQSLNAATAGTAANATNATQLGGVAANQYVQTADSRLTDARTPTAGSTNYVQNTTSQQTASNFNISGTGTANVINAGTVYQIGGSNVLSVPSTANTFIGLNAGIANTGVNGTFVGNGAGQFNTSGTRNSFFGTSAGLKNTTGNSNSFFGVISGTSNTTGGNNSFFGDSAGAINTTGGLNAFFGYNSGLLNTTGSFNSFFGASAGMANTTAINNSFFGQASGFKNTTGQDNTFIGNGAGFNNVSASRNTFTGSLSGFNNTTGDFNSFYGYNSGAANTTSINNSFFGQSSGVKNTTGQDNTFIGNGAGFSNVSANNNTFVGSLSGQFNTTGISNSFFGFQTGQANTTGNNNTLLGNGANLGASNLTNATAIGANALVSQSNSLVLGNGVNVGIGTPLPGSKLTVAGLIETTTGGVKFPDGTIQTTALTANGGILNQITLQASANFNISGTGTSNAFNSGTNYQIGGNRVLSSGGTNNIFAGNGSGQANTSGAANSFFGFNAGTVNTSGSFNSFFGSNAGAANTTSINNSFFGQGAGFKNTTGHDNTFVGNGAGLNNVTANGNTFVGSLAGQATSGGINNTFLGINAGVANVGSNNNTFVGANAANTNLTGSGNTYIGANTDGAFVATNATAIGQNAFAGQSNSLILGGINGVNGAIADTAVGIGTSTPQAALNVFKSGAVATSSTYPVLVESNTFGVGMQFHSSYYPNGHTWSILTDTNGNGTGEFFLKDSAFGTNSLMVTSAGSGNSSLFVDGTIALSLLTGGQQSVCINSGNVGILSTCSSSLRYKKNIEPFSHGLNMLNKLHPITFRWKSNDAADLGFGAEDVAKVEPLLVTHNAKGEVEGVKYDRISAVLVNAVKEQQTQIELLRKQIDALQKLVCLQRSHAKVCKEIK